MENILIQIIIAIVGGFILNLIWDIYQKYLKDKLLHGMGSISTFLGQFGIDHPILTRYIKFIICCCIMFLALNLYINTYRMHNKMDKDWITFDWVVYEDDKIGNNFISSNYSLYAQRGNNNKEIVVRQLSDATIVQVYKTDFYIEKPNVFFSKNNIYALVTENNNVNIFSNLNGELISSFIIQDKKVNDVLFIEDEQVIFIETIVNENDCRLSKYDMVKEKIIEERLWADTILLGITMDLHYYIGLKENILFVSSLSDLQKEPLYGENALHICTNGVSAYAFDQDGKYYLEINTSYSTRIDVRECVSNKIIYNIYVYDFQGYFFDKQDHLYIIHQGYIERIDLLAGNKKIIVDLSTISETKGEKRVGKDYTIVSCCYIYNSKYLAAIVYEPQYKYNRIYLFDINTEEIIAMSNSVGFVESGYIQIVEKDEILYVLVIDKDENSIVRYPLLFDNDRNLIF